MLDLRRELRRDVDRTQPTELRSAIQTRAQDAEHLPARAAPRVGNRRSSGRLAAAIVGLGLFAIIVAGLWSVLRSGGLQPVTPTCGVWTKLTSPGPGTLDAVDAVSPTDVWAVGTSPSAAGAHSVLLHFDGRTWTRVDHPDVGELVDVLELAPDDVWAIGTKALHFDGSTWTVTPLPKPAPPFFLAPAAISAVAPDDIWLAGTTATDTLQGTVLHWDGMTWTTVETPLTGSADSSNLFGVSAASANDVWVAGSRGDAELTMHWDGTTWKVDTHPGADPLGLFYDVIEVRPDDAWAVGGRIEHFDGTTWSVVGPPPEGTLTAVTAIDPTDVWVVGSPGLILHFDVDASTWTRVSSPALSSTFLDVSATGGEVWAVGSQTSGKMLLAHFCS